MALFLLCPNLGWIQGQFNFTELSLRYPDWSRSRKIAWYTPLSQSSRWYRCTVDLVPYLAGTSSQVHPVVGTYRMPLINLRGSHRGRPMCGFVGGEIFLNNLPEIIVNFPKCHDPRFLSKESYNYRISSALITSISQGLNISYQARIIVYFTKTQVGHVMIYVRVYIRW